MEVLSDISSVRLYSAQTYQSFFLKVLLFKLIGEANLACEDVIVILRLIGAGCFSRTASAPSRRLLSAQPCKERLPCKTSVIDLPTPASESRLLSRYAAGSSLPQSTDAL